MEKKIYIAGAHYRAITFKKYIEYLYPETQVEAFLVSNIEDNKPFADGVQVKVIGSGLKKDYPVYIGTRGVNHKKITKELKSKGMEKIIPVTVSLDSKLRNEYVKNIYMRKGYRFQVIDDMVAGSSKIKKTGKIYVASSVYDPELKDEYEITGYEKVIQVGAALTKERLKSDVLTDNTGDNISERNRQYCELTGMYWMWKNDITSDYKGLCHYRRHFILPVEWVDIMNSQNIDVILPVPLYVYPNIQDNYKERHDPYDWDFLMEYLQKTNYKEYLGAIDVFHGNLYNPCNMFIMKKEILDQLCTWLFPILDAVWKNGGEKEDAYFNRYPGFISERLITFYFEYHRKEYNIVYANKNFLS